MALLDDIGADPKGPPSSTGALLNDIGFAPKQSKASPISATTEGFGDVIGNSAKHLARGIGKLLDIPGQIWDTAFHPEGEDPANIATDVTKKVVGDPKNESSLGRIVGAAEENAPSAILGGPEALLPTMASGAASQAVAEMGAGSTGQTIAGLTPFVPGAATGLTRKIVRGGAEGAANMQENIQHAKDAGLRLSAGQVADNTILRSAETVGSKLPGGKPIAESRGPGLNKQVEESVSNIIKKISPDYNQNPPTPVTAGDTISGAVDKRIAAMQLETSHAREGMEAAVGGKDAPWSAPKLEATLSKVTGPTGMEDVDNLVKGAKTKAIEKTINAVTKEPRIPTSYSVDGNGSHHVTSPNGETEAVEDASNNVKIIRSDTSPSAQGKGEGTTRLEILAHVASGKGKSLVSDISISPAQAAAYEKLGRKGWNVQKNPNATVNSDTGNIISDSPKNPVYTVTAPTTKTIAGTATTGTNPEQHFEGQWTYDPKTGKSEPVTSEQLTQSPDVKKAVLNPETPWTFDSLRALRTNIGQAIGRTTNTVQKGQLKMLYGSVSDDLEQGAASKGTQAEQAYGLFNSVAKQNAGSQKLLSRAIRTMGGPEAVFKAAIIGTKDGASKLTPIFNTLDNEGKGLMQATVLHRMGRVGGAADAPFDANTFMKNWQGMSPEAKNLLFNTKSGWGAPGNLRSGLDSLNDSLNLLKKQGYIKSGLGKEASAIQHTAMGGVVALLAERAAEAGAHLASGNHLGVAAAVAGGGGVLALNPIMSRVLTNPKTAAWLAQATRAPKGMVPILLNQLNQMGNKDPDAKDLADLIAESK